MRFSLLWEGLSSQQHYLIHVFKVTKIAMNQEIILKVLRVNKCCDIVFHVKVGGSLPSASMAPGIFCSDRRASGLHAGVLGPHISRGIGIALC